MARVTIEDCIDKVDNRFDLILLAAHRARELSVGATATLDTDDEKMPVVALRELAAENIKAEDLKTALVKNFQTFVEREEPKPEPETLLEVASDDSPESQSQSEDDAALAALEMMFEDADTTEIED